MKGEKQNMNKFLTKVAKLFLGMAMAAGVGVAIGSNKHIFSVDAAQSWASTSTSFVLATSLSKDDEVIIAAANYNVAMGAQNGTYIKYAKAITKSNNKGTATVNAANSVVLLTVGTSSINNTSYFTFNDGNGYLVNNSSDSASSNKNRINTTASLDTTNGKTHWSVTFNDGIASITSYGQGSGSTRKTMSYNLNQDTGDHSKDRFSCYSGIQGSGELAIYKKVTVSEDKIDDSTNPFTVSLTPTVSRGASLPSTSGWTVTAKLVGKDTPASITSGLSIVGTPSTETVGNVSVTLRYTASTGGIPLNSGNSTYDFTTSMTVNPQQATVSFKETNYIVAPNGTLTLADEVTSSGDGDLSFSVIDGNEYVSISNGVLTAIALGTATIRVVKQYGNYTAFSDDDTATIEVSNVASWSHTFATSGTADFTATNQTKTLSNASWKLVTDGGYYGVNADYGQQIGSGSNPATSISLSSSAFEGYSEIKSVKVTTGGAKDVSATVSVVVGETTYKCGENDYASYSLSTAGTNQYVFQAETPDCGDITISWSQTSTSKAIYIEKIEVFYDNTPIAQGGIKASWATGKGTYYNGSITSTTTFSSEHLVINTTNANGKVYGDANTTGSGFKVYLKNGSNQWVKTDKTTSESEVMFIDATSTSLTQAMTGFGAGTYSLYVTTAKAGGGVWTSNVIDLVIVAKAPQTITRASEPTKTEFISYVDAFTAFTGKINVSYNDGATDNNRTPAIKYFSGDDEVDLSTYLNSNNKFKVNSNTTLTVRLYDNGYVGGDYVYNSYSIYIYSGTFACTDGNGANAEYESGATVALNPAAIINYTNKDSVAQVLNLSASDVDLYIKVKGASGDGDLYEGTLPEVNESTQYTITAVYKGNSSYKASYDITIVNATFSIDTSGATKTYAFGTNFSKTGLVVQIQYGSSSPTTIAAANYTVEDENGNELDVIKFIGTITATVRYKGYSATYEIKGTNVGSSETYIHDDIPGGWALGSSTTSSVAKSNVTSANLGSSSRLAKGSSLSKQNAFGQDIIVGKITVIFQVKSSSSSNAGATFTFKMVALSGSSETTNEVTGITKTLTSSYSNVTFTIDNIPASDNVNGWKIVVTNKVNGSGNANGNAEWDNFSGSHTPYSLSDDQTFNACPAEQAIAYAKYFNEEIGGLCDVGGNTSSENVTAIVNKWSVLKTEYAAMTDDTKDYFAENASQSDIARTLGMYLKIIERYKTASEDNFIKDSSGNVIVSSSPRLSLININGDSTGTVAIIVIISMVSMTAIGGYFFLRNRKEN